MKKSLLFLLGCFIFSPLPSVYGQIHHRDLASFLSPSTPNVPVVSAHRGGRFYPGLPENSLSLFKHVSSEVPVFIECDVQMSHDSVLFLLHDDTLERSTTGTGLARAHTWRQLHQFHLVDDFGSVTDEKIPSLESVLKWAKGETILVLDIKDGVAVEQVVQLVRGTNSENDVLLIAYNLAEAKVLHAAAPEMVLSVSMNEVADIEAHKNAGIPLRQCVAFTGTRLQSPDLYEALRLNGILSILGTMNEADPRFREGDTTVYAPIFEAGVRILATDHPIEVTKGKGMSNVRGMGNND